MAYTRMHITLSTDTLKTLRVTVTAYAETRSKDMSSDAEADDDDDYCRGPQMVLSTASALYASAFIPSSFPVVGVLLRRI